ncbi:MAG: hypothetical protein ACOH18_05210 [Candidatus Saccharimonadaceae bacterium]
MPTNSENIYALTKQRLEKYGIFSDTTIESIATFAQKQSAYNTYQAFFKAVAIPAPHLYVNKKGEGVEVVDIPAKGNEKGVIVLHLPMGNPLDANQLYNVATIIATNPKYRVIAFGNPSSKPFSYKEQNLTFWKRFGIGSLLNLQPLVAAENSYLQKHKVSNIHHIGYSYGVHKALVETFYTKPGMVTSILLVDPVAHPRGIKQLIEDFLRAFKPMGEYVNRTKLQTYFDARAEAARTTRPKKALSRPINIAIGFMMDRLDFIPFLKKVIASHPGLQVTVAWGSKSELGNDALLSTSLQQLAQDNSQRVNSIRLKDDTHAFANDIHLYAAIIRESLLKTEQ